ncbi:helix-turn-helix transcriptional regulator [Microvirga massiliensis]|uniref:helix-turn-helix transcriptional regulator n=1 Tax=Microvirga massiliensis TaxID=1033741 RepID=UPI000660E81A|nr:helix-turn-helix domain-containing protein [Microvirga massiliensis]
MNLVEYDFPPRQRLNQKLAARYLGVSPETLSRWRRQGTGPRYIDYGSTVRYCQGDLDIWLAMQAREPAHRSAQTASQTSGQIVHINELRLTRRK